MRVPQQISDPISENLAKLAELFPAAVKDGALDVEALRAELGDFEEIKPGDERYELNWVGKQAAKKESFKPLLGKTLSLKVDGKNSETTKNIYIEGDNLEALKLLRQNYYGEVKMIYIDPPYNTGKDFVYKDNFTVSVGESDQQEGSVTTEGQRLIKNERTSNRFHAQWLDMMYPRLKLAKDLLRQDGVIFISIDDNEVANLRAICNEIFGEENLIAHICHKARASISNDKVISENHNTILLFAKNFQCVFENRKIIGIDPDLDGFSNPDGDPRGDYKLVPVDGPGGAKKGNPHYEFLGVTGYFRYSKDTMEQKHRDGLIVKTKSGLQQKYYLKDAKNSRKTDNTWWDDGGLTSTATRRLQELMKNKSFDTPKPVELIHRMLKLMTYPPSDALILDFFSGSATTAHAIMQLNAEDGGRRRYIMVQINEICDEKSEAYQAGYKTIAEIGKERIRRAGEKIKDELKIKHAAWKKKALDSKKSGKLVLEDENPEDPNPYVVDPDALDIGFKSFRIEDTKINWLKKDLRGEQLEFDDTTTQDALDFVPGYTDTDVVYELMLRQSNIPLTGTIIKPITTAKRTYLYADAYLICLEEKITQKLVESLATIEPTPNKYFFRDSAFGTDIALKDETFRRLKAEIHKHHGDLGSAYTVEFI